MKAAIQKLILPLVVLVLCGSSARAQVSTYNIFKVANYHQVDATQPAEVDSPDAEDSALLAAQVSRTALCHFPRNRMTWPMAPRRGGTSRQVSAVSTFTIW